MEENLIDEKLSDLYKVAHIQRALGNNHKKWSILKEIIIHLKYGVKKETYTVDFDVDINYIWK